MPKCELQMRFNGRDTRRTNDNDNEDDGPDLSINQNRFRGAVRCNVHLLSHRWRWMLESGDAEEEEDFPLNPNRKWYRHNSQGTQFSFPPVPMPFLSPSLELNLSAPRRSLVLTVDAFEEDIVLLMRCDPVSRQWRRSRRRRRCRRSRKKPPSHSIQRRAEGAALHFSSINI